MYGIPGLIAGILLGIESVPLCLEFCGNLDTNSLDALP